MRRSTTAATATWVVLAAMTVGVGRAEAVPLTTSAAGRGIPDADPITVTLTLVGADEPAVTAYATAVTTPGSVAFHQHLTHTQLRERFAAPADRVARVSDWAHRSGFTIGGLDATGTRLTIRGTTRAARRAFAVGLTRTTRDGLHLRATTTPHPPATVARDIRAVTGLAQWAATPLHTAAVPLPTGTEGQGCARYWGEQNNTSVPQKYPTGQQSNVLCGYTGPQLRALYGLGDADRGQGQTIVIVGAFNRPTALSDANTAFAAHGVPTLPADRYTVKRYATSNDDQGCDVASWNIEQALDVQTVHTIAPDAHIVYAAAPDCTALPDTLAAVIADASLGATIVSNSWGIQGGEPADPQYLTATNTILARAAILGIGTYAASGDSGDNSTLPGSSGPSVMFPASSPWTTAVGGTTSALNASDQVLWQTGWETAANTLTSAGTWQRLTPPLLAGAGGGNSQRFDKPTWQAATPGTTRSVPDIAALADPFTGLRIGYTTSGGYVTTPTGGTSLATPIVASLVAVAQARAGDADAGFLAPVLYAKPGLLTDVRHVAAGIWTPTITATQSAGNYLLDVDSRVQSLTTGVGYDQVTGLGVPGSAFLTGLVG